MRCAKCIEHIGTKFSDITYLSKPYHYSQLIIEPAQQETKARMLMKQNVNNDVTKDSPISNEIQSDN